MKGLKYIFLGLLAAIALNLQAQNPTDKAAIEELVSQYVRTINEGDAALVDQIWMHDAHVSFIGPMGRFSTYQEIRDNLVVGIFGTHFTDKNLRKTSLMVNQSSPTTAWVEFEWEFDATRKSDGGHHHTLGRETQLMRKVDGAWKLEHIHYQGIADSK